ncbi:MAG: efflux RND transporter periplasmic adaptor subunit [Candidatus Electrothrix aestuarii]|uniref:Efflux RND transporter periplasmic adaptor subunit n=1 Tax=Candidatus Electrothrix aestuarii TaxID=3062594 RepID=A0AAU8LX45_9BACT|nr:efflux RND transporter periplasmic adaptor subunit [Candidatus Electrothrix aestuarii]
MQALLRYLIIFICCGIPFFSGPSFAKQTDSQANPAEHQHKQALETIWTCSMHPQIQLPESGQCPLCFMDLIEVEKQSNEERLSLRQISLDRQERKLAEIEVQPVTRGNKESDATVQIFGRIDYDETRVSTITSWVDGRIDKLFVDYTGATVQRGQAVAEVYSPNLFTAQAELIQAAKEYERTRQSGNELVKKMSARTLEASREKLHLLGIGKKQIQSLETQSQPTRDIPLTAPLSGIVIEKHVNEGMYVKTGNPVYTLADLAQVWVILEVYETDLHAVSMGQKVGFTVEAYPGTQFQGKVVYIDPLVDEKNRTVRVRLNAENKKGKLKPGMFVRAELVAPTEKQGQAPLLIPASAPLLTGKRALVYVQVPDKPGTYIGREIVLGSRRGAFYEIRSGLEEGELVVVRGNFKIDSAIQLQARPSMMNPYSGRSGDKQDKAFPELFTSRLDLLNQDFVAFSREIHKQDGGQYRSTLQGFKRTLSAITEDGLKEEERLSWQEFAMLLKNDLILLQEAEDAQEAQRIYVEFAEHFHQIRERFAIQDVPAMHAASPELQAKVGELLKGYLILQQNLAADNEQVALESAAALPPLTSSLTTALPQTAAKEAGELANRLEEGMHGVSAAGNLAELRTAFSPYSQAVVETVESYGSNDHTSWFVHFCPMAFDNTGASWLAPSEEINNPYFGAMMLRCGEVRKQLTQE